MNAAPKAFTLIELMIVVAIIAIVAAIAIPNLMQSRLQANEAAAIKNLQDYAAAQAIFRNNGYSLRAAGASGFAAGSPTAGNGGGNAENYDAATRRYAWPFSDLHYVKATGEDGAEAAGLVSKLFANAAAAAASYQGYWYIDAPRPVVPGAGRALASPDKFTLFAVPAEYGVTGAYVFAINELGLVKSVDWGEPFTAADAAAVDPWAEAAGAGAKVWGDA